jgi:hypothetical protein
MNIDRIAAAVADAVRVKISAAVAPVLERIAALEGRQPEKGDRGEKGEPGSNGKDGAAGRDGASLTASDIEPLLKSMQAEWALDFERRAQALFQKAIDNMPVPKDGRDGIGWEDMRVEYDDDRTATLVFEKDGVERAFPIKFPVVLDRGFWRDGLTAEKGDGYTHAGSYWIATQDTDTRPEVGHAHWRLAVRRGRDAKSSARLPS